MTSQKRGGGSDNSSSAGLLDLLNDVKQSVEQEQRKINTEAEQRQREERERAEREEALRRQEAQQRLNEETRARNEALSKLEADTASKDKSGSTAQHARPKPIEQVEAAPVTAAAPQPQVVQKKASPVVAILMLLVGLGIGAGAMFAMTPKDTTPVADAQALAATVVKVAKTAAARQAESGKQVDEVNTQVVTLKGDVAKAQAENKKLREEIDRLKKDAAEAKTAGEDTRKPTGPRRTGTGGTKMPSIKPGVF